MSEEGQRGMIKSQKLLRAIKDWKQQRAIFVHILKKHDTQKIKKVFSVYLEIINKLYTNLQTKKHKQQAEYKLS